MAQHYFDLDTRTVEKYIRARGTTSLAAVRLPKEEKKIEDEELSFTQRQAALLLQETPSVSLFDNPKIEVPDLCLPERGILSTEEYASLAYAGEALQKCWVSAAGEDPESLVYNDLPLLNNQQLATFYDCATQGESTFESPKQVQEFPDNILLIVNFGDIYRSDISWLETMVYVCTHGQKVDQKQYMAEPGQDSLYSAVLGGLERQDAQRQAREKSMYDQVARQVAAKQLRRRAFDPFRVSRRAKKSRQLGMLAPSLKKVLKDIVHISRSKKFLKKAKHLKSLKSRSQKRRKIGKRLRKKRVSH